MAGTIKHKDQTLKSNNPAKDVSANAWNAEHTIEEGSALVYQGLDAAKSAITPHVKGSVYIATDTKIIYYNTGSAWTEIASGAAFLKQDSDSAEDMNNNPISAIKTATYNSEIDNGNSGTSKTIDWTTGQKQKITMDNDCTFTFTAPSGPCNLILKIISVAGAAKTITYPVTVKWVSGTKPALSGSSKTDILSLYFDGTNYYSVLSADFS